MSFAFRPNWQWLTKAPLTPAWRRRLELTLGAVMASAAVVVLSTQMKPSPSLLASRMPVIESSPPSAWELEALEARRMGYAPPQPSLTPEFRAAVAAGDVDAMKRTYQRNMPLNGLLQVAAKSGKKPAVVWLLEHGADIHEDENTQFAPILAADAYPEIIAHLREKGAPEAPLEAAAGALAKNAVTRILAKHPNVNERFSYPLRAASSTVPVEGETSSATKVLIIKQLLDAGADPNHGDDNGSPTALAAAVQSCSYGEGPGSVEALEIVKLLLSRGAKVQSDALAAALSLEPPIKAAALTLLLEHPFDKGVVSHALAEATSVDAADLKRVIKAGGGVDWAWHDGEDDQALPLIEAARRGERDTVRAFLDAGAPVDMRSKNGECALGVAIESSGSNTAAPRIVELLVQRGANVNRRLPDGRTPLFAAAEAGDLRTVNFLIEKGARVNDIVLDDSPLDAAEQNGHTPIARVLHAHGGRRNPRPPYTPYTPGMYGGL